MKQAAEVAEIIHQHRTRKAMALADTLRDFNYTVEDVQKLTDHGWHIVSAAARVKLPSAETRSLVVRILEAREFGQRVIHGWGTSPEAA